MPVFGLLTDGRTDDGGRRIGKRRWEEVEKETWLHLRPLLFPSYRSVVQPAYDGDDDVLAVASHPLFQIESPLRVEGCRRDARDAFVSPPPSPSTVISTLPGHNRGNIARSLGPPSPPLSSILYSWTICSRQTCVDGPCLRLDIPSTSSSSCTSLSILGPSSPY